MKASESVVFANGEVGPLTTAGTFRYEVEKAENDQYGNMVTTVKCHGKVTSETAWELREAVKPLLALGGAKRLHTRRISFSFQMFDEPLRPAAIDIHLANGIRGEMSTHRVRKESHGNSVILERVE